MRARISEAERDRFDALFERVAAALPPRVAALLEEVPVVLDDAPDPDLLDEMGESDEADLLGLHTGTPFTEQSVESPDLSSEIRLFRVGIIEHAGGWEGADADDRIAEEIRITLLHEIGHQFGLDEDDLERLGYD